MNREHNRKAAKARLYRIHVLGEWWLDVTLTVTWTVTNSDITWITPTNSSYITTTWTVSD